LRPEQARPAVSCLNLKGAASGERSFGRFGPFRLFGKWEKTQAIEHLPVPIAQSIEKRGLDGEDERGL